MICGAGSFSYVQDDNPRSLPTSPKRWCTSRKANKNPYSTRGLDKFSDVLAELDAKRQSIMNQLGSHGVSTIRFTYTDSNWVPIIVKQEPQEGDTAKKPRKKCNSSPPSRQSSQLSTTSPQPEEMVVVARVQQPRETAGVEQQNCKRVLEQPSSTEKKRRETQGLAETIWRQWLPNYWLLVMLMILVCLAMSGRTFAICCTCIWWYVVPVSRKQHSDAGANTKGMKQSTGSWWQHRSN